MTELEQILFIPVDFPEICNFSKIAVFKELGDHFEINETLEQFHLSIPMSEHPTGGLRRDLSAF